MSLIRLFLELANINSNGVSRIICTNEFIDKYSRLSLGNGGSWCRLDSSFGKKYKIITIKKNGKISYSWDIDDIEKINIKEEIDILIKKRDIIIEKGISIKYIKLYGYQNNNEYLKE